VSSKEKRETPSTAIQKNGLTEVPMLGKEHRVPIERRMPGRKSVTEEDDITNKGFIWISGPTGLPTFVGKRGRRALKERI